MPVPTVGRIVHYVSYGTPAGEYRSQCRAAIVAEVPASVDPPGAVALAVLNPTGVFFNVAVQNEDDHEGGTWHWPERA